MSDAYFNFPEFYRNNGFNLRYRKFVEVGVHTGASVVFLAKVLRARNHAFTLWAVDLWEKAAETGYTDLPCDESIWKAYNDRLQKEGVGPYIRTLKMSSIEAAAMFEDQSLDFVFIDADHAYESVKADIEAWLPKIRKGGRLAGHDIDEKTCGVEQAVQERFGQRHSISNNCWYTDV